MNAYDAASPSELLMAFIEGDLEGMQEDFLFSLLHQDQGLRIEMRELLAVNRLAQHDAERMRPPAEWKTGVMAAVAGMKTEKEREKQPGPILLPWYRSAIPVLLALLVGVLGTFGVMRLANDDADNTAGMPAIGQRGEPGNGEQQRMEGKNFGSSLFSSSANTVTAERAEKDIQALEAKGRKVDPVESKRSLGDPSSTISSMQVAANVDDEVNGEREREQIEDAKVLSASLLRGTDLTSASVLNDRLVEADASALARNSEAEDSPPLSSSLPLPSPSDLHVGRDRLQVGYRHNFGAAFPNVSVPAATTEGLGEISLSLLYRLDDHLGVGIEGGRGNFPQIFRTVENGERVRYEQNPTLFWSGGVVQYSADPVLLNALRPIVRLGAGGTVAGPLGRGLIGVEYMPESHVAFTAGVEGAIMLYRFDNAWLTSRSLDFTYGISVRF